MLYFVNAENLAVVTDLRLIVDFCDLLRVCRDQCRNVNCRIRTIKQFVFTIAKSLLIEVSFNTDPVVL